MLAPSRNGEWDAVTKSEPCIVCNGPDWCARKRGGDAHRCMRGGETPNGMVLVKESTDGGRVFAPVDSTFKPAAVKYKQLAVVERADPDQLHRVYSAVLASLPLTTKHRGDLKRRGLTDEHINRGGYRSLGTHRHSIMRAVESLDVSGVPGFYVDQDRLRFGGAVGLLIPIRDQHGRIVGLSVRADDPKPDQGKYTWCSSKKRGGAGSGAPPHVPSGCSGEHTLVRITEGGLKADVAWVLSKVVTLGVAGTASWRAVVDMLREMKVITVRLAFDMDAHQKHHVAEQLQKFYQALVAAGLTVEMEVWDGDAAKGIDDALQAGEQITVLAGSAVQESIEATVRQAMEAADTSTAPAPEPTVATVGQGSTKTPTRLCTDLGNAERLIDLYGDRIRYCHPWGKWLIWDGKRWRIDDTGMAQKLAQATARSIWDEARAADDPARREELGSHAAKTEKADRMAAMLKLAQAMVPVLPGELDQHPWLLNCINGTVDLKTGIIREHRIEDMLTAICPVTYDITAACPLWNRTVTECMKGRLALVEFLQRAFGLSLVGEIREHLLVICYGNGSNGKSVMLNTVQDVLGPDYAMKAPPDLLMVKGDTHPTERADLFGKRFVLTIEVEDGKRLAEGLVKEITGGDDIRARRMREDFWQFKPSHHPWLACNHKPVVRGSDNGIWRRLRLVPFDRKFEEAEQDLSLPTKLKAEASGILAWMVKGCLAWQQHGLGEPIEVKAATADYRHEMDVVGAFIEERCVVLPTAKAKASALYSAYRNWAEEGGEHSVNQRRFGMAVGERGFEKFTNNGQWYRGIGLRFTEPST